MSDTIVVRRCQKLPKGAEMGRSTYGLLALNYAKDMDFNRAKLRKCMCGGHKLLGSRLLELAYNNVQQQLDILNQITL